MATFGEGYRYHVTGLIHDDSRVSHPAPRRDRAFLARLFRKISTILRPSAGGITSCPEDAEVVLIAYGCVARSATGRVRLEARNKG